MGMVAHQFVKICPTKAPNGSPGLLSLLSLTVAAVVCIVQTLQMGQAGTWNDEDEGVWEGEK